MARSRVASIVTFLCVFLPVSNGYFMYVASPARSSTRMPPQRNFELNRSPYSASPARTVLHPAGFVSKPPRIQPAVPRAEHYRAAAPTFAPPPSEPRMVSSDHLRRRHHHHHRTPEVQASYTYTSEVPKPQKPHRKMTSTVTENEIAEMVAELEAEKEQEQKLADILPRVTFECKSRAEGYYADMEFACEVFHYCGKPDGRRFTFFCPPGSRFNQIHMICDYDKFQGCDNSQDYYHLNENLYPKEDPKPDRQMDNQLIPKSAPPPNSVPTPHRTHHSSPRPMSIPLAPVPQHLKHQASNNIIHTTSRPIKQNPQPHSRSASNHQKQFLAPRSSEEDAIMTPAPRKRHHQKHHPSSPPQHPITRSHHSEDPRMPHGFRPQQSPRQAPLHSSGSHRSPVQMMVDDNDIGPMAGRFSQHGSPRPPPNPHRSPHHHHPHPSANQHPQHVRFVEGRHAHSSEEFDTGFPGLPIAFQRGGTFGRTMSERPRPRPSNFEPPHEHIRVAAGSHHHHHHERPHPFEFEEFIEPHFLPSPSALVQQKPNSQEVHKSKSHLKPHSKPHSSHSSSHPPPHSSSHPPSHSSSHPPPHSSSHPPSHSSSHPPSPHSHTRSRPPSPSNDHNRDPRPRHFPASPHPNHISESRPHERRPTHHTKPMSTPAKHMPRPTSSEEVIKEESVRESLRAHPTSNPHRIIPQNSHHPRPHQQEKHREPSTKSNHQEPRRRPEHRKPVLTTLRPQPRPSNRQRQREKTSSTSSRERHNESPFHEEEEVIEYTSHTEVRAKPQPESHPKPRTPKAYPKDAEWSVEKQLASLESREEFARTKPAEKAGESVKAVTRSPPSHNNHIHHEYKAAPAWNSGRTPVEAMTSEEEPTMSETIETKRVSKLSDSSEKSHENKIPELHSRTHPPHTTRTMTSDNHLYRTRKPVATSRKPETRPSFRSIASTTTTTVPISEESSEEEEPPVPIATTTSTSSPTTPVAPAPTRHRGIQRKRIQSSSIGGRMNNWPLNNRPAYKRKQATTTSTPSEEEISEESETTTNTAVVTTHRQRRIRPNHGRKRTRAPAIEPTETTPTSTVQTTPLTPEQPEKITDIPEEETEEPHTSAMASDRLDVEEKSYIR